ncbi:MAG: amino acid ABC transporter permease [Anaerofustis stercorihominis]|nr:amino acid ABC transporter permease [Anaerofustis stercorihominis]
MDKFTTLYADIVKIWGEFSSQYLSGIVSTLSLAFVATAIGCIIGLVCGILQTIPYTKNDNIFKRGFLWIIRGIVRIYVEVFRGTPMVLQAMFIYFAIPYFTNNMVNLDVIPTAYLVVSINTGAYMAETVRGGILSIDPGQTEGAKAIGMNHLKTMLYVILPQTIKNIIPQIGNNFIINIKDTSVMFIIGYTELFTTHKAIAGAKYVYFPSAAITMVLYLALTVISSILLRWWEDLMDGPDNFDVATTDTLALTSGTYNYRGDKKKKRTEKQKAEKEAENE